jgi:hypothetical protein
VIDNITFDSLHEGNYYEQLKLRLRDKHNPISNLEVHKSFSLDINGIHICNIEPDFCFIEDGKLTVHDAKGESAGCAYELFKVKKKLFLAIYGIDIVEIRKRK